MGAYGPVRLRRKSAIGNHPYADFAIYTPPPPQGPIGMMVAPTPSSRACAPFVMSRNANTSVTVIAAHQRPTREMVVIYQLDDVRRGLPTPLDDATLRSTPPDVRCDGQRVASHIAGCRGMCRLEVRPARTCEQLELQFPSLQLGARSRLCAWKRATSHLPVAMACAYVFVPPATESSTLQAVVRWASLMAPHVSQLHLHVVNRGSEVRRALLNSVPRLLEHKLVLHAWDWVETFHRKGGLDISRTRRPLWNDAALCSTGLNPYHVRDWTLTKSVVELRDQTEWLMLMDVDESFGSVGSNITLQGFLGNLHPQIRQYGFCEVARLRGCRPEDGSFCEVGTGHRSKSTVRLSSGCAWWPGPHYSIPVNDTGDAERCELTSHTGKHFGTKGVKPRLEYYRHGLGCHPTPREYIVHDRL